jgi:hypothetical protein
MIGFTYPSKEVECLKLTQTGGSHKNFLTFIVQITSYPKSKIAGNLYPGHITVLFYYYFFGVTYKTMYNLVAF